MLMKKNTTATTDALEIIHGRFYDGQPDRVAQLDEARANDRIARQIRELRTAAGLTQSELAKRAGTTASVISRLENAGYEGHSMAMLRRIAAAVGKDVEIRFVPLRRSA
jgi:DNA-binding XRE family transcriptional regulator